MSTTHIDGTGIAAVDEQLIWRSMDTCPVGVKVQMLGESGIAVYNKWDGKEDFWLGWFPLPKRPSNGS